MNESTLLCLLKFFFCGLFLFVLLIIAWAINMSFVYNNMAQRLDTLIEENKE